MRSFLHHTQEVGLVPHLGRPDIKPVLHLFAEVDHMVVGIDNPRGDGPALEVDDPRARPPEGGDLQVAPDLLDLSLSYGQGLGDAVTGVHGEYVPVVENEISGAVGDG